MTKAKPWYREPWPWLLMSGPAVVVVAGAITTVIAVRTSDGLVAADYYKQGLSVNRVIAREKRAGAIGVAATVQFNEPRDRVRAILVSSEALPPTLRLKLLHPTRGGEDRAVILARVSPGVYEAAIEPPGSASYQVQVEDDASTWRLSGRWKTAEGRVTLGATP